MFSPLSLCLSVCFFVCVAGYLKKLWTDPDETWWTGWVCEKDELIGFWWRSESGSGYENYLIFKVILHHWQIGPKTIYSTISQKVVDGFGWMLVDRLGVWHGRIDSILVKIWIRLVEFFKVILHHWEIGPKTTYSTISQKVVDGFGWNLVDRLGVWPRQNDLILVKIPIWIWLLEFLKWFFIIET